MKEDIGNKKGIDMTRVLEQMLSSSRGETKDGVTELTLEEAEKTQALDTLVVTLDIPREICSNYSKVITDANMRVSDDYAKSIAGRLLLKAAGSKALGVKRDEIDVSDKELQSFYDEHDLGAYTFDDLMSARAQQKLFGGQEQAIPVIRWRWNNGLMFMDYQDRVLTWMKTKTTHSYDLEVNRIIGEALAFHQVLNIISNDFEMFVESEVYAGWNPISKSVFDEMTSCRLTLDRAALDALSKMNDQ